MRAAALAFLLTVTSLPAADAPAIRVEAISPPTHAKTASGPAVSVSPEGVVWLSWVEREAGTTALKFALFDAATTQWSAPGVIASGPNLQTGHVDFPTLALGPEGRATAVWYVTNPPAAANTHQHHGNGYRAYFRHTSDQGKTWSAPAPVSGESAVTEFVSVVSLADGRVLAAWLGGSAKSPGAKKQPLFSRILGTDGPDVLVDGSVCECCHTALTAFPDGSALLAYRGRTDGEIRDIKSSRFRGNTWDESRVVNNDEWKVTGCPVNGPQVASDGGRVAVAWFTGADDDPRVLATLSPDAGGRFMMPLRLADGTTAGRVSTLMLHDGAMLVSHVDSAGGLWLRRVTPDFVATEPVQLVAPAAGGIKGFPRMALLRDYAGGPKPAQLITTFTRDGDGGLGVLLVTIPESELLEAEKSCDCGPTVEQLQGFPIRGAVISARTSSTTLEVKHFEVPGIFPAGSREFKVDPELLARAGEPDQQFLGRVEKRAGAWWLFDVRLIASAPTK